MSLLKITTLPICLLLIGLLCFRAERNGGHGIYTALRLAMLKSLLITTTLSFAYTEISSAISQLTPVSATLFWFLSVLVLSFLVTRHATVSIQSLATFWNTIVLLRPLSRKYRLFGLVLAATVFLPLCFEALYGTPNNLDSNNYHLLRIVVWMKNQNVAHFPTYHVQQLYHNVLSEYLIMQTMLLSGTDRFANMVQFVAMLGALSAVSLLGKRFGFDYKTQIPCAALLLFLPIGIFESTTTQNDYVACFFFLSYLVFGYSALTEKNKNGSIVFMALALAFGGFTKYPILLYAFPFCLYFGFRILTDFDLSLTFKTLAITLVAFLLIFSPFFYRNFQLFGNVLAPPPSSRLNNESIPSQKHSLPYTLSTLSKNVGIHLGLPNDGYNKKVDAAIDEIHHWLRVDPYDLAVSNNRYYTRFVVHEDYMPNTLHFLLLVLVIPLIFWKSENLEIKILSILAVAGILLFSTLLKYQPFSSRTQMPFFAVGCILIAYTFQRLLRVKSRYLLLPFFFMSLLFVYGNPGKMLVPFRYYSKLALGHLPRDVCPSPSEIAIYRQRLSEYYDFSGTGKCFPLRAWPDYSERIGILGRLDELGFTKSDRAYNLLSTSRIQNYYMNHVQDYGQIIKLLPYLPKDGGNIGVMYGKETGYYHHLQTMEALMEKTFDLRCVYYRKEYESLENAQKNFEYRYILSDSLNLARQKIDSALVKDIIRTEGIVLVRLKENSDKKYLY